jgi:hypothetical protein
LRCLLHLWNPQGQLEVAGPLQVANAALSIDAGSASWRRLTGDVVLPAATAQAIEGVNTFNGEISVELGIGFQNGVDWVQVAQLRIEESTRLSGKATRTLTAFDRAIRVNDFPFITPYAPRDMAGVQLSVVGAIVDIITTAFPSNSPPVFVVDPTLDTGVLPPAETSFTGARWDAVLKLAQSIGATVHNDRLGRFLIRSLEVANAPVATLRGGAGGTLVAHGASSTRVEQFNAVGMTSESPSGDGIFVYVVDADPQSPTYYDGPFGRKPFMTRNDTVTTLESAIAATRALLAAKRSGARDLDLDAAYDPLLQPLDVVTVFSPTDIAKWDSPSVMWDSPVRSWWGEAIEQQVVDSIELPLTGGRMQLKTHLWTAPATVRTAIVGGMRMI